MCMKNTNYNILNSHFIRLYDEPTPLFDELERIFYGDYRKNKEIDTRRLYELLSTFDLNTYVKCY